MHYISHISLCKSRLRRPHAIHAITDIFIELIHTTKIRTEQEYYRVVRMHVPKGIRDVKVIETYTESLNGTIQHSQACVYPCSFISVKRSPNLSQHYLQAAWSIWNEVVICCQVAKCYAVQLRSQSLEKGWNELKERPLAERSPPESGNWSFFTRFIFGGPLSGFG